MKEYVTSGIVQGGKLQVRNRKAFDQAISRFRDGEVSVTIERYYATRSEQQNRWYHSDAFLGAIAEQMAEPSKLHAHELCKQLFNSRVIVLCNKHGEIIGEHVIAESTTKLNKLTFGDYLEAIRRWAAMELGIAIPDPDPDWREKSEAA